MRLPAFDHAYVKRLKIDGFTDEQAEAHTELQAEFISSLITGKLVNKTEISNDVSAIKQSMTALSAEKKQNIASLATEKTRVY